MGKRILIIDDDEDILFILNVVFGEEGYEVLLYNTGTTAEHLRVIHPDLILMDVRIIGYSKTGAEICKELKTNFIEDIPVLLLSAEEMLDEIADDCKADGFVNKPFDVYNLLTTVKKIIN